MRRDTRNEMLVALSAAALLIFAAIFGIILSGSDDDTQPEGSETPVIVSNVGTDESPTPKTPQINDEQVDGTPVKPSGLRDRDDETEDVEPDSTTTPDTVQTGTSIFSTIEGRATERQATQNAVSASETPIPIPTDTPSSTATSASTDTESPPDTEEPTSTPVPSDTATALPSDTATAAPTETDTAVETEVRVAQAVTEDTDTPVPTDTDTPVPTDTDTPVPTDTDTPVPTDTDTPVPTDTDTPVPTDTNTPVPTDTNTPVPTDTDTPVPTDTDTPVPTGTGTPVPTDTDTPVSTDTDTPVPTETDTPVPTETGTPELEAGTTGVVCEVPENWIAYKIRPGNTLWAIARAVGSSIAELGEANCLQDFDRIFAGDSIYVPQPLESESELPSSGSSSDAHDIDTEAEPAVTGPCAQAGLNITSPMRYQQVTSPFAVIGTANWVAQDYYKIEVRPDWQETFNFWSSSSEPVVSGQLGLVDPEPFGNGLHWIRVTIVNIAGNIPHGAICDIPVIFG